MRTVSICLDRRVQDNLVTEESVDKTADGLNDD